MMLMAMDACRMGVRPKQYDLVLHGAQTQHTKTMAYQSFHHNSSVHKCTLHRGRSSRHGIPLQSHRIFEVASRSQ